MATSEETGRFEVFADLDPADCGRLCRVAAAISPSPGAYAMHPAASCVAAAVR